MAKHWHHLDVGPSDEECVCRTKPMDCASSHGSPRLLMDLNLGRSQECSFDAENIKVLKREMMEELVERSCDVYRTPDDRRDVSIDFRFLDLLLHVAEDPKMHIGSFATMCPSGQPHNCHTSQHFTCQTEVEVATAIRPNELHGITTRRGFAVLPQVLVGRCPH